MNHKIAGVIAELEAMPKQGDRYEGGSVLARRNPIRADTGALLQAFVVARRPMRILELGTAFGLSGLYLASALSPGGKMDTIEFDADVAAKAQENFDRAGLVVRVLAGDADEIIPKLGKPQEGGRMLGRYSCVFLDADKRSYARHLKMLIDHDLLMPDCLILADNVIDRQAECSEFLEMMQDYPHAVVPTECGLLVGRI